LRRLTLYGSRRGRQVHCATHSACFLATREATKKLN
jgi:hypothetical protein